MALMAFLGVPTVPLARKATLGGSPSREGRPDAGVAEGGLAGPLPETAGCFRLCAPRTGHNIGKDAGPCMPEGGAV